jgi:hypothetical protein
MGGGNIGNANGLVHVAMLGWIPLCLVLFLVLKRERAVAAGIVTGMLLLPNYVYPLSGIPDFDKYFAINMGVLLGALVFDLQRILTFRPRWVDLPIAGLVLAPLFSVLSNDRQIYEGLAGSFNYFVRWGVPWLLGRLYISTPAGLRALAVAMVCGALIYLPFCAFEAKMSPLLHSIVYGIKLKSFKHAQRGLFWRPNVFMEHGLMCALFLGMAALAAFWLWQSGARKRLLGMPMGLVTALCVTGCVGANSSNALLMMTLGAGILWLGKKKRWSWPLLLLACGPPTYLTLRHGFQWEAEEVIRFAETVFGRRGAISLHVRFANEAQMDVRCWEKPWFGWADFNEFTGNTGRTEGPMSKKTFVTVDSMWLLYLGLWGRWGLAALFLMLLLPAYLVWKRLPAWAWDHPELGLGVALAVMALLFACDSLLNAFEQPMYVLAAGGAAHLFGTREGRRTWEVR